MILQYGVVDKHYDVTGGALLETLRLALEPSGDWTPEAIAAWTTVYGIIAGSMKEGARTDPEWEELEAEWARNKANPPAPSFLQTVAESVNWSTVAALGAAVAVVGVTVAARFRDSRA